MLDDKSLSLIDALNNCVTACNYCATSCLDEADVKMMTNCIKLDMDCAAICQLTATLIARGSDHGQHLLKECVEICNKCADECQEHGESGMEHCKDCADACRECAEVCAQMEHA
ncbi:MAG: four-helix bundle copper-binding protein [Ferruginibacter sp.]